MNCLECGFRQRRLLRPGDTRRYYEIEKSCRCASCGARGSAGLIRVDLLPADVFAPGADWAAILFEFLRSAAAPVGTVAGLFLTVAFFFILLAFVNATTGIVLAIGEQVERAISAPPEPAAKAERIEFCRTRLHWLAVSGPESLPARMDAFSHLRIRCPEFGQAIQDLREVQQLDR